MKSEFVDCFMLIGTALSLNNNQKLPEMTRPLMYDSVLTFVNISLTVQEIHFIDVKNMEIEVTLLLHQRWIDPRLGANVRTRKMAVAGQIWRPKVTITKGLIGSGINNEDTQFWRGFGDEGNVLLSEKIIIKTYCTRNLRRFPFDSQICELKFGTYRFPIDEVELKWQSNAIEILTGADISEFEITNVSTFHEIDIRPSGNFSILVVQFFFKRHVMHYVLCTMVPCVILVLLSYISFWIDCKNVGVRLGLSISVLLFLIYLYNASACLTVAIPFLKYLDLFIALCTTFSFISLFENCVVSYIYLNINFDYISKELCTKKNYDKLSCWIELSFRIAYPLFYISCLLMFAYCTVE